AVAGRSHGKVELFRADATAGGSMVCCRIPLVIDLHSAGDRIVTGDRYVVPASGAAGSAGMGIVVEGLVTRVHGNLRRQAMLLLELNDGLLESLGRIHVCRMVTRMWGSRLNYCLVGCSGDGCVDIVNPLCI